MMRTTRFEVDLDLVAHNLRAVRAVLAAGPPGRNGQPPRIAAVLKGNAYGLGSLGVAKELLAAGADMLAVACLPEAIDLRRAFPDAAILVMGETPAEYFVDVVRNRLRIMVFEKAQAEALSAISVARCTRTPVHLKIDTGMNRLGLKPDANTGRLLADLAALPGIHLEGLFTHLALRNRDTDEAQFTLFLKVVAEAKKLGVVFPLLHVCDSIGMVRYPQFRLDMVRPGAILYGVKPIGSALADAMDIRTPFALRSKISRVCRVNAGEGAGYDESWQAPAGGAVIATIPVGYADGYARSLSNKAEVIVRGRRAPVVGLVMMDQTIIDVTGIPGVAAGDEVLLLGRTGVDEVAVMELADWIGTNRNEVISMIGHRVPRVYSRGNRILAECDHLLNHIQTKP